MIYRPLDQQLVPEVAALFVRAFNAPPWNDQWTQATAEKRLQDTIIMTKGL